LRKLLFPRKSLIFWGAFLFWERRAPDLFWNSSCTSRFLVEKRKLNVVGEYDILSVVQASCRRAAGMFAGKETK